MQTLVSGLRRKVAVASAAPLDRLLTNRLIHRCIPMRARVKKALPLLAIAAIIVLSLVPGQLQVRTGVSRHLEHFAAYFAVAGVLAFVWGQALLGLFSIGVLLMGLAAAMELAQVVVPGRTARLSDLAASDLGVAAGLVAMWIVLRLLPFINRAMPVRRGTKP